MQKMLGRFEDTWDAVASLVSDVMTGPCLLLIGYGVWLGARGEGWWWAGVALLWSAAGFSTLLLRFRRAMGLIRMPRLVYGVLLGVCSMAWLLEAPLLVRLFFGGVLSGLYQSIFQEFSVVGIVMALIAGVVTWYCARGMNTFFFLERTPLLASSPGARLRPKSVPSNPQAGGTSKTTQPGQFALDTLPVRFQPGVARIRLAFDDDYLNAQLASGADREAIAGAIGALSSIPDSQWNSGELATEAQRIAFIQQLVDRFNGNVESMYKQSSRAAAPESPGVHMRDSSPDTQAADITDQKQQAATDYAF
jgi:hypothetical protein